MKNLKEIERLLIVVDVVNGFIREGKMADPYIERIIPENVRLVKKFLKEKQLVMFIKDCHELGCTEFNRYPVHCVKGTYEAEIVDELKPYEKDCLVYEKNSTSFMFAKGFINDLEKIKNLKEVVITGDCTDICVLNGALPLQNYFDENDRDVKIIVPKNAVETYGISNVRDREEWNQKAFDLLDQGGIQLIKKY